MNNIIKTILIKLYRTFKTNNTLMQNEFGKISKIVNKVYEGNQK